MPQTPAPWEKYLAPQQPYKAPKQQYQVKAPDGKVVTLEGPAGASEGEIIAQAQRLYKPQVPPDWFEQNAPVKGSGGQSGSVPPTPPPGFILDGEIPPPPPGFVLDSQKPWEKYQQQGGNVYLDEHGNPIRENPHPMTQIEPPLVEQIGAAVRNAIEGAGKGLAETLANSIQGLTGIRPAEIPPGSTETQGTAQAVGKGAERIAEFMAGGAATSPAKATVAGLTKNALVRGAANAGLEGLAAAGVTAAQQGKTENAGASGVTATALNLAIPAALKAVGKLGVRMENILVKPTAADIKDGFKPENVFKYNVGGSLDKTAAKVEEKLAGLSMMAEAMRKANPKAVVNVKDALRNAAVELVKNAPRNQGMNQQIEAALVKELNELDILVKGGFMDAAGNAPVDVAHHILQSVGERGAWAHGAREAEAAAYERVANAFYSQLRQGIEGSVPNGSALQQLNRSMLELIPIKNAIIRRIPVEQRNAIFGLNDLVMGLQGIPVGLLHRLAHTGTAANAFFNLGRMAEGAGTTAGRLAGAGVSGLTQQAK